jgi:DNA-binding transcriptional regulator YhcF (GntR family)
MNDAQTFQFIKEAMASGYSAEDIRAYLVKQSSEPPTVREVIHGVIKEAGFVVNTMNEAFIQGILKEALDAGATFDQATNVARNVANSAAEKQAAINGQTKLAEYTSDFIKAAVEAGYTEQQGYQLLAYRLSNKTADDGGMGDMLKPGMGGPGAGGGQPPMPPPPGPMPGGAPGGMPPGADLMGLLGGAGGGQPGAEGMPPMDQNQLMQLLQLAMSGGGAPGGGQPPMPAGPPAGQA